ncbi:MAG: L-glutamate gamma-semialdehyde dehydrogenase [Myxococcales bacterium]|nr:L-glutamate gamma-semialdehyde dehydrogenase [Myxococcales bacterium]
MINAIHSLAEPVNEPVDSYDARSPRRAELKAKLAELRGQTIEIPLLIGGKEVRTGRKGKVVSPHEHGRVLAEFHMAGPEEVAAAADAAAAARAEWQAMPWQARLAVFRKAGDLLATEWRATLNAATMLGQSKTAHQAEIDAACELIDFLRFNVHYATKLMAEQPASQPQMWNYLDHRPLEGFVLAITPFNFTAIGGNLPTAPAMMGNTVLWKPASTAVLSNWHFMRLLREAGLPPGVINFVPGAGREVGPTALARPDLAGVHFTGSTGVFQGMWRTIGDNIASYKTYPRIVGETGGKDFIVAHSSADVEALAANIVRGAYEYQGQKCSACSRLYLPQSLYPAVRDRVVDTLRSLPMGSPLDFRNFMCAVIDAKAFKDIKGYIDFAKASDDAVVVAGGECDDSEGYFISPTLVQAKKHDFKLMQEEIFGPVLTFYVYPDAEFDKALEICDSTSPYALTGAIFAQDRRAAVKAMERLRHSAGNFYINDKPTGAVVGQQPFGGARASGTNDKAGSPLNLMRWVSPRAVKENFVPARDYRYPYMEAE